MCADSLLSVTSALHNLDDSLRRAERELADAENRRDTYTVQLLTTAVEQLLEMRHRLVSSPAEAAEAGCPWPAIDATTRGPAEQRTG